MKLFFLALLLASCGAREVKISSYPRAVSSVAMDYATQDAIDLYADNGHPVVLNYPVIAVKYFSDPFQLGGCFYSTESNFRYIAISVEQMTAMSHTKLVNTIVHEIAHCSFHLGHTTKEQGDVMSPMMTEDGTFSQGAWSDFWASVRASEQTTTL